MMDREDLLFSLLKNPIRHDTLHFQVILRDTHTSNKCVITSHGRSLSMTSGGLSVVDGNTEL
jgi:hypothetical protein